MGCQSEVELGANLVFSVVTHDPHTGIATDADALPHYHVYEDETGVPILAGDMALLDAVNTAGFYTEQIACTAANGFEYDKTYTIDIQATVLAHTAGISYAFRISPSLSSLAIVIINLLLANISGFKNYLRGLDLACIYRGDTWTDSIAGLGDLTGTTDIWLALKADPSDTDAQAKVLISLTNGLEVLNGAVAAVPANGVIAISGLPTAGTITVYLNEVETAKLVPAKLYWDVQKRIVVGPTTTVSTPKAGRVAVEADIARVTS